MTLPDGSKMPGLIQLIQWIANPLGYLEASVQRYGDIFTVRLGDLPPLIIVSNPQAIKEIFTADPKHFNCGEVNKFLQPLIGSSSMALLDGEQHQYQRQMLMPSFHGERIQVYSQLICDITNQILSQYNSNKPFPIYSPIQEISLQVILTTLFGRNMGQPLQKLKELTISLLDTFNSPLSASLLFFKLLQVNFGAWSPWGRFLLRQQQIDQIIYATIQQRREQFSKSSPSNADMLTLMMSTRDTENQLMSDQELRDQLLTLLLAGHETTTSTLTWALYWIHYFPEVREKLLDELDSLNGNLDPNIVCKLPYLTAVCQETLRIYPVAMVTFPRITKSSFHLMGYEFEAGTAISPCTYLTHQREDIYPEPKHFKPERFLKRQFSPYEYFPFGGSNRRCIGMTFAQFEMKLVLATILSCWKLAIVDQHPVQPIFRGITLAPPRNMLMTVVEQR